MWRWIFSIISVFAAYGAFQWVSDPVTFQVPFTTSLYNHLFFTTMFLSFMFLMLYGILHKMFASRKIVDRVRSVLTDFNMSCDENGRLILNARPLNSIPKDSSPGSPSKSRKFLDDSLSSLTMTQTSASSSRLQSDAFRSSASSDLFPQKWYQ